jgi:hypothetical protein
MNAFFSYIVLGSVAMPTWLPVVSFLVGAGTGSAFTLAWSANRRRYEAEHPVEKLERAIDEVVTQCPEAVSPEAEERVQRELDAWLRAKTAACAAVEASPFAELAPRGYGGTRRNDNA